MEIGGGGVPTSGGMHVQVVLSSAKGVEPLMGRYYFRAIMIFMHLVDHSEAITERPEMHTLQGSSDQ